MKSRNRFAVLAVLAAFGTPLGAQAPAPKAPDCTSPGHRQFDFWVGTWDVYPSGKNEPAARSVIEKLYVGCVVRENWYPNKGTPGGSFNSFRPKTGEWRQIWTDSGNEIHDYRGRWTGTEMDLSGIAVDADDQPRKVRMTFTPNADGSVTQTGYKAAEDGNGWTLDYQLIYRRSGK